MTRLDKLHVGCGVLPLDGWCNIDIQDRPGVDLIKDVREGLPGFDVRLIYAEHFIEHLSIADALAFLKEARRVLHDDGVLRLSTPNLDWVMLSHYRFGRWLSDDDAMLDCLGTNLAFHGWGHQFLYNYVMISRLLRTAGFRTIRSQSYGESDVVDLRGLERHPPSPDWPGLPHVVIVEAEGTTLPTELPSQVADYITSVDAR